MKHVKKYEVKKDIIERKVYWIIPFYDNRFEDAIVQIYKSYTEWKTPVKPISDALELAKFIREIINPEGRYVCISMEFSINDLTQEVVRGPIFRGWSYEETNQLEDRGFIFVGRINIPDYEWDANKYNL